MLKADASGERASKWGVLEEEKRVRGSDKVKDDPKGVRAAHAGQTYAAAVAAAKGETIASESVPFKCFELKA